MEVNFKVGDIVQITGSAYSKKLGQFVTIKKVCNTQAFVVYPDGEEEWIDYDCITHSGKVKDLTTIRTVLSASMLSELPLVQTVCESLCLVTVSSIFSVANTKVSISKTSRKQGFISTRQLKSTMSHE